METRQAVLLRPGQSVSCEAEVASGSRLDFAAGLTDAAPAVGAVRVRVEAGRTTIHEERLFPALKDRWQPSSAVLPQGGRVRLTFRVEHVDGEGRSLPPSEGPAEPWIALGSPRVTPPERPGAARRILIWISQDTVRADHLSAYGYPRPTTPRFDRLARDFALFENGVATASWTLPSLASQFTSRYPSFHGAVTEGQARDPAALSLFEILSRSGFTVLGVSGNLFVSDDFGLASGFDTLWYTEAHADDVSGLAERTLDEWPGGDLALFVHYQDPHHPYTPPPPYDEAFDHGFRGTVDTRNPAHVEHTKALYDGEIAYTDHEIQQLLRVLKTKGILDRALVVYSADHGEEFLDHGGWAHARTVYQELVHVPFALRIPDVAPRRVGQVVSLVDLAPTVLDAFGIAAPQTFQGRSLLPFLRGGTLVDEPAYAETQRNAEKRHLVAVREGKLKYVLATHPGLVAAPEVLKEELYDVEADPSERKPLASRPETERLRRYALGYLTRAAAESRPAHASRVSPETEDRLRALGYIQ
jgi:arylsulfatase A-like enzyme